MTSLFKLYQAKASIRKECLRYGSRGSLCRLSIIMSTRNQVKMFNIKHLKEWQLSGILFSVMRRFHPKSRHKRAYFAIFKSFPGNYGQLCPIINFGESPNIEVNYGYL